jgi:epoxyqueuosine reductase
MGERRMESKEVKDAVLSLGADVVGVASVDRFHDAPRGFKPTDIYADARSVIVYGMRIPATSMFAASPVPYTFVNDCMKGVVDNLSLRLALWLEERGLGAVTIPSDDPYEHWEPERSYGRAILSLRHAGRLAGLGFLGRSTLLINEKYGSLLQIGAVLIDEDMDEDVIVDDECPARCRLCIDNCPARALDGKTVDQKLCRPLSNLKNLKGYTIKKCNVCRRVCPLALGTGK